MHNFFPCFIFYLFFTAVRRRAHLSIRFKNGFSFGRIQENLISNQQKHNGRKDLISHYEQMFRISAWKNGRADRISLAKENEHSENINANRENNEIMSVCVCVLFYLLVCGENSLFSLTDIPFPLFSRVRNGKCCQLDGRSFSLSLSPPTFIWLDICAFSIPSYFMREQKSKCVQHECEEINKEIS